MTPSVVNAALTMLQRRSKGAGLADIFISYKAEDRRRVSPLVDALGANGYSIWWDARIGTGLRWRETIQAELDKAACVIVVWSKRSIEPGGSFVRDEASCAMERGVYLPIKIDNIRPPLGFGEMQALPLLRWNGDQADPRFETLLKAVKATIAGESHSVTWAASEPAISRRTVVAAGASIVAVAAGGGWLLTRPKGGQANSIAVLPFANLSGSPAESYFADGIAEEIRSALARIKGLTVIGRSSSEAVKSDDAPTAARRLGVQNILSGSVRRSRSTVRISAELIDGKTGADRWSQDYDRAPGDAIAIQTDIATSVAGALEYELLPTLRRTLTASGTGSREAEDHYFKGVDLGARGDDQSLKDAIVQFDAAIALDPGYAEAFASKAEVLTILGYNAPTDAQTETALADALEAAQKAVKLAPNRSNTQSALGVVQLNIADFANAAKSFDSALVLGADGDTLRRVALFRAVSGAGAAALALLDRAAELDPLNPLTRGDRGIVLYYLRKYPGAIVELRNFLGERPDSLLHRTALVFALILTGKLDEAESELSKISVNWARLTDEALLAARRRDRARADRAIAGIVAIHSSLLEFQFAQIRAQLGQVDEAIASLHRAVLVHDAGLRALPTDPFLDPLRDDPRFKALLVQLKFPAIA